MFRTIITPKDADIHLVVPKEYIGKTIEITVLSLEELGEAPVSKRTMADFWGILSDATAQDMHKEAELSRESWDERLAKQS